MANSNENIQEAIILLKAIANEKRLEILCLLSRGDEKNVGDILKEVNLTQSALSQHLARLRKHNIVKTRRDAQTIYYSIASDNMNTILASLNDLYDIPTKQAA